ncbi:transcriptional regulator, MarR family [Paenibacillus curdlanolyticus YK9]|uniref:Transcriptional regulator, MarR family n=1 Tax=Paenibacillus curdlanolyticus YK9 TaxID=717606 RepID=E0IE95_9BACL|nr:MarR family transcriptional regulator [Paenibacillus curdlanolyticus]EFM08983.1 transcriptional regulator, MarR family [Paenibacillus curdlanolyticus YK9]
MDRERLQQTIDRYIAASFTVNRRLSAMIRDVLPDGITAEQSATLRYLRENGRSTSSELADIFCVGKSSITAIITRLFDKHLIERVPDEKDRRVTYLVLTPEGEQMTRLFDSKLEELLGQYLIHFDNKEAKAFIETYEKLAAVLVHT